MIKKPLHLSGRALLLGLLGATAAVVACSGATSDGDDGPSGASGGPSAGASGSGAGVTGGQPSTGGQRATGGATPVASGGKANSGGSPASGGAVATGGSNTGSPPAGAGAGGAGKGGSASGGTSAGGTSAGGTNAGGAGKGGSAAGGMPAGGSGGQVGGGMCTASKSTGKSVSGTGPHEVVIETNSENGIKCGTIYRPKDLGGAEKYPILVWGEGGCSQNGSSNQAAMGEIASWGYFVVADGTPGGTNPCQGGQDGKAFLDYITWAIAENSKPCSAYYQSLETTKIAADGFSCGGLMAENVSGDPRFTAIGITSSGLMGANAGLYDKMHAPFKIMNGGPSDIAYENGLRDYEQISSRDIPIVYFAKTSAGHGGDLNQGRGDFNLVNLAWLNWQLKGDEGATGKAFLHGASCEFCTDPGWEYKSANIP